MVCGEVQEFTEDATLYTWGDRRVDFFVVLEGQANVSVPLVPSCEEIIYATSVSGVFAVGDVRAGSNKRVASAVGEGSIVVAMLHSYLSTTG